MNFDFIDIMGISQLLEWGKEKLQNLSKPYKNEQITPVRSDFTPKTLEEYIGQEYAEKIQSLDETYGEIFKSL